MVEDFFSAHAFDIMINHVDCFGQENKAKVMMGKLSPSTGNAYDLGNFCLLSCDWGELLPTLTSWLQEEWENKWETSENTDISLSPTPISSRHPRSVKTSRDWRVICSECIYLYKAKTDRGTSHRTEAIWAYIFYRETYFPGFLSALVNSFSLPSLFTCHENWFLNICLMSCFDLKGWYKFLLPPWAN